MEKAFDLTIKGIILEQADGTLELDFTDFGTSYIDLEELIITALEPYITTSVCGDRNAIAEEMKKGA